MLATPDRFRLDDQTALVTGGAGLYGEHICRALAEVGAHVVVASRTLSSCEDLAESLRADGLTASALELDQGSPESIERAVGELERMRGGVDVLINNAVARGGGSIAEATADELRATAEVNYVGLVLLTQQVAAGMVERRHGSIVNIASIYGNVGPQFAIYEGTDITSPAFYAFEKGGMVNLTRYLAAFYGPHGIRVNCLSPGGLYSGHTERFVENYSSRAPLGRQAGPDDIKGPVVFLASEAASYVHGANLMVDGGWTAV